MDARQTRSTSRSNERGKEPQELDTGRIDLQAVTSACSRTRFRCRRRQSRLFPYAVAGCACCQGPGGSQVIASGFCRRACSTAGIRKRTSSGPIASRVSTFLMPSLREKAVHCVLFTPSNRNSSVSANGVASGSAVRRRSNILRIELDSRGRSRGYKLVGCSFSVLRTIQSREPLRAAPFLDDPVSVRPSPGSRRSGFAVRSH
jgi:hypothetical protein